MADVEFFDVFRMFVGELTDRKYTLFQRQHVLQKVVASLYQILNGGPMSSAGGDLPSSVTDPRYALLQQQQQTQELLRQQQQNNQYLGTLGGANQAYGASSFGVNPTSPYLQQQSQMPTGSHAQSSLYGSSAYPQQQQQYPPVFGSSHVPPQTPGLYGAQQTPAHVGFAGGLGHTTAQQQGFQPQQQPAGQQPQDSDREIPRFQRAVRLDGLSDHTDEAYINTKVKDLGEIEDIYVKQGSNKKNYGIVVFRQPEGAHAIIKQDKKLHIKGKTISVSYAMESDVPPPKQASSPFRSGTGSNSNTWQSGVGTGHATSSMYGSTTSHLNNQSIGHNSTAFGGGSSLSHVSQQQIDTAVFVTDLPAQASEADLRTFLSEMENWGKITKIVKNAQQFKPWSAAVQFETPQAARMALTASGRRMLNSIVRIEVFRGQEGINLHTGVVSGGVQPVMSQSQSQSGYGSSPSVRSSGPAPTAPQSPSRPKHKKKFGFF